MPSKIKIWVRITHVKKLVNGKVKNISHSIPIKIQLTQKFFTKLILLLIIITFILFVQSYSNGFYFTVLLYYYYIF